MDKLSKKQEDKYFCTTYLKEIGVKGQLALLNSRVFIVGVGGLGNQILLHLASIGVGEIAIADNDIVNLDNLPRQILYGESDVSLNKVDVAANRIKAKNPDIKIIKHKLLVDAENSKELFKGYDLVIDATDNFKGKFIIEDARKE